MIKDYNFTWNNLLINGTLVIVSDRPDSARRPTMSLSPPCRPPPLFLPLRRGQQLFREREGRPDPGQFQSAQPAGRARPEPITISILVAPIAPPAKAFIQEMQAQGGTGIATARSAIRSCAIRGTGTFALVPARRRTRMVESNRWIRRATGAFLREPMMQPTAEIGRHRSFPGRLRQTATAEALANRVVCPSHFPGRGGLRLFAQGLLQTGFRLPIVGPDFQGRAKVRNGLGQAPLAGEDDAGVGVGFRKIRPEPQCTIWPGEPRAAGGTAEARQRQWPGHCRRGDSPV